LFGDLIQYAPRVRFGALGVLGKSARHFIDSRSSSNERKDPETCYQRFHGLLSIEPDLRGGTGSVHRPIRAA
jgi:hypothetical protein